jgi:1-deoxy-D-xylulose-5-phosphate reductoisomerase
MKKKIAILGSTGSIGTQALEIAREQPALIEVEVLTAHSNADLLIAQAKEFCPNYVVIADESKYAYVKNALADSDTKVFAGSNSIAELMDITTADTVLTAMVGYSGLLPTIKAIENNKRIALANKETLVVAGELITELCTKHRVEIIPVDSEHSAIFQCLTGESYKSVEKLILTASGGPFRGKKRTDLTDVKKEQALKHPNWSMGAKITIDSATLMNKGLEVIEARWLFGIQPDDIDVIVHPQSIIHSMVQFTDGSIKAQMGLPDMKLPIHYAFFYPERIKSSFPRMNFDAYPQLTFEKPDTDTFQNLSLAYEALRKGGNMACILNAANEITVEAFLKDRITFLQIAEINALIMQRASYIAHPALTDYIESNTEAREIAADIIKNVS